MGEATWAVCEAIRKYSLIQAFLTGLVARACGADTCAHGTCSTEHIQGYDFGCDCDKDWFGIKCDKSK